MTLSKSCWVPSPPLLPGKGNDVYFYRPPIVISRSIHLWVNMLSLIPPTPGSLNTTLRQRLGYCLELYPVHKNQGLGWVRKQSAKLIATNSQHRQEPLEKDQSSFFFLTRTRQTLVWWLRTHINVAKDDLGFRPIFPFTFKVLDLRCTTTFSFTLTISTNSTQITATF